MIEDTIRRIESGYDISSEQMEAFVSLIAEGKVSEDEIASFLTALSKKTETSDEITGAVRAMRKCVSRVKVDSDVIMDTCGTGADNKRTFNVSTISAFVVAGAGIKVAKHGNRSVSGSCGSADLLESMGVNIDVPVETIEKCIKEINIGFLFAPSLHPAMRYVQPVRRKLKIRTIFNIMGPLINPAFPTHQLIGVYEKRFVPILGRVLKNLELKHAMVVWGEGGYDEAITMGETFVCELKDAHLKEYVIDPAKLGFERHASMDVSCKTPDANKQIALNVLKGLEGPQRDMVILNSACCLYMAGKANTIKEAMAFAYESIDSGAAIKKLNKLIEYTAL